MRLERPAVTIRPTTTTPVQSLSEAPVNRSTLLLSMFTTPHSLLCCNESNRKNPTPIGTLNTTVEHLSTNIITQRKNSTPPRQTSPNSFLTDTITLRQGIFRCRVSSDNRPQVLSHSIERLSCKTSPSSDDLSTALKCGT